MSGIQSVYRYTYGTLAAALFISERKSADLPVKIGAVFTDLQLSPNLGAWHGSECKPSMTH